MKSNILRLIFVLTLLSCEKENKEDESSAEKIEFETEELVKRDFSSFLKVPAEFKAYQRVDLFPKVDGYIENLLVDRGDEVEKGQVLVSINAPEVKAKLANARAELESKLAEEMAEKSTFLQSKDDWERFQKTAKMEGAISTSELYKKEQQFKRDSSRYESAKMKAKAAVSFLKAAEEMNNYLVLKAPFKGKISERNFHSGAYVSAQQQLPVVRLNTPQHLRLEFLVPEEYARYVNDNDSLEVGVRKNKSPKKKMKISRRSGEMDVEMRGEYFEANYNSDSNEFKPGNFVEVEVPLLVTSVFVVDESNVKTTLEDRYIEVVDQDQNIQQISVNKGLSFKGKVIIYGNLQEGMQVIKQ